MSYNHYQWQRSVLDATNSPSFKEEVKKIIKTNPNIIIDLSSTKFLDSSGLGAILALLRQSHTEGGDICLFVSTTPVLALLDLMRINRVMHYYKTLEEAQAHFQD